MVELIQEKFSIEKLKPPKVAGKRQTLDCMHLLVTQMVVNKRKVLNAAFKKAFGIRCVSTKSDKTQKKDKNVIPEKANRKKKCIYPWMIRGDFVSIFLPITVKSYL